MKLDIPRFSKPLDLSESFRGSSFQLRQNWYGGEIQRPVEIFLLLDPRSLVIAWQSDIPPEGFCTVQGNPNFGDFTEGLWQGDVFEVFLFQPGSEKYWEINLAPSGAWWSRIFKSYRTPDVEQSRPNHPEIFREEKLRKLSIALRLKREDFEIREIDFPPQIMNLTAIVSGNHLTLAPPRTAWPDFHLPYCEVNIPSEK